jgi:hypothetical protein
MTDRNARALLVLSWIWLALVAAYSIWGVVGYAGLFRWLAELQIGRFGGYSEKATAVLPGMLLAAPALWFIHRQSALASAAAPQGRLADIARIRRNGRIFGIVGGLAAAIGAAAFLFAQRLPDGSEDATPFDIATLATTPIPSGRIAVRGEADTEASASVVESGRIISYRTFYAGFRPEGGSAKGAPLRLFIERSAGSGADPPTNQYFLPEQTGYLVENGLPGAALHDLRSRGIRIASPHYLLRPSSDAWREPYYVVAGLGAVFGSLFLLVGLAVELQMRMRARRG